MNLPYRRELKKFGIRAAHTPQKTFPLSGVVLVNTAKGKGYVYVQFSPYLVKLVDAALPMGVSIERPCYLTVSELITGKWRVSVRYLYEQVGRVLWEAEKPKWIRRLRKE